MHTEHLLLSLVYSFSFITNWTTDGVQAGNPLPETLLSNYDNKPQTQQPPWFPYLDHTPLIQFDLLNMGLTYQQCINYVETFCIFMSSLTFSTTFLDIDQ